MPQVSQNERKTLKSIQRGDLTAFEGFCAQVEGRLLSYVRGLVQRPEEAEDIAQEALFRLYRAVREGRIKSASPRPLLFSIAHNLAMDYHRRQKRVVNIESIRNTSSINSAERTLLREQIDLALANLPHNHRAALMLREFGELTYREIADTLGATHNQTKVWIHRGRKQLAELLDADGQYIGGQKDEM